MIRSDLFRFGCSILLTEWVRPCSGIQHPEARASSAGRDAGSLGQSQRPLGISVRRRRTKDWPRAGRSPAQRDTTRRSSCRFRGRASCPEFTRSRSAEGGLVSPPVQSPRGVSRGKAGLAPVRSGRLAGRRLGERPESRRARGGLHAVRGRHLRCRSTARARTSSSCGRSTRPTRTLPTGKQVGWYTPSSGIWQTVWLESRPKTHIAGFPDRDQGPAGLGSHQGEIAGFDQAKYQLCSEIEGSQRQARSPRPSSRRRPASGKIRRGSSNALRSSSKPP